MRKAILSAMVLTLLIVGVFAPSLNVQASDSDANTAPSGEGASLIGSPTSMPEPTPQAITYGFDSLDIFINGTGTATLQAMAAAIGRVDGAGPGYILDYWTANKTALFNHPRNIYCAISGTTGTVFTIENETMIWQNVNPSWNVRMDSRWDIDFRFHAFNARFQCSNQSNDDGWGWYGMNTGARNYFANCNMSGCWAAYGTGGDNTWSNTVFFNCDISSGNSHITSNQEFIFTSCRWERCRVWKIQTTYESMTITNCIFEANTFYGTASGRGMFADGTNHGTSYFYNNTFVKKQFGYTLGTDIIRWNHWYNKNTSNFPLIDIKSTTNFSNNYVYDDATGTFPTVAGMVIYGNLFEHCAGMSITLTGNAKFINNYIQNTTSATIVSLTFSNGTFANNRFHHANVSTAGINVIQIANNANSFFGSIYGNRARMNRTQLQSMMPIFSLDAGKQCCGIYISNNMLIDDATGALISPSIQVYATALQPDGCCVKIENQSWYFASFGNYKDLQLWNCSAEYDWNQYGTLYTEAYNQNTSSGKPWPDSPAANRIVNFSQDFNFRAYGINKTVLANAVVYINDSANNSIFSGLTDAGGYLFANGTHFLRWGQYNATMLQFEDNYSVFVNKSLYADINETFGWEGYSWTYPGVFDAGGIPLPDGRGLNQTDDEGFYGILVSDNTKYFLLPYPRADDGQVVQAVWVDNSPVWLKDYLPTTFPGIFQNYWPNEKMGCVVLGQFETHKVGGTIDMPKVAYNPIAALSTYFAFARYGGANAYVMKYGANDIAANFSVDYADAFNIAWGVPQWGEDYEFGVFHMIYGMGIAQFGNQNHTGYMTPVIPVGGTWYHYNNLYTHNGVSYSNMGTHTFHVNYAPRAIAQNYTAYAKAPVLGLDASGSYDPDNSSGQLNYTWIFWRFGTPVIKYGSTLSNITYNIPGTYTYTLIVRDFNNAYGYSNGTITVLRLVGSSGNPPPSPGTPKPPALSNDTIGIKLANFLTNYLGWVVISSLLMVLGVALVMFRLSRRIGWIPIAVGLLILALAALGILPPLILTG